MKKITEKGFAKMFGFDPNQLNDFNWAKDRLFLKLVNPATYMPEKLEAVALKPVANLALQVNIELTGVGVSATVSNEMLKEWGITLDEAIKIALENETKRYKPQTIKLADVGIAILSDKETNGATVIFNKKVQKDLRQKLGEYYILPSSMHELICIPKGNREVAELEALVRSINEKEVSAEDYLSDNVYELVDGTLQIAR